MCAELAVDPARSPPTTCPADRVSCFHSFIIDHYDDLPDYMLFLHPTRYQWHNDDPDYDGLMVLRNFQVPYLEKEGYVNLRCAWQLGCPNEIKPYDNDPREKQQQGHAGNSYFHAFKEIFGDDREVPEEVGVSCCAQFALTRDKVHEIPKEEYMRLRNWLAKTPLTDAISGRVMEYSWHSKYPMPHHHYLFFRPTLSQHQSARPAPGINSPNLIQRHAASTSQCSAATAAGLLIPLLCCLSGRIRICSACCLALLCACTSESGALGINCCSSIRAMMRSIVASMVSLTHPYSLIRKTAHSLSIGSRMLLQRVRFMRSEMPGDRHVRWALYSAPLFDTAKWMAICGLGLKSKRKSGGTRRSKLEKLELEEWSTTYHNQSVQVHSLASASLVVALFMCGQTKTTPLWGALARLFSFSAWLQMIN